MNDIVKESALDKFLQHFHQVDFSFDSEESLAVREAAKAKLAQLDFPTTKAEYWKYTRVAPLVKNAYVVAASQKSLKLEAERYKSMTELVFVNGFYRPDLSSPHTGDEMIACSLSEAKTKYPSMITANFSSNTKALDEVFAVLNTAYHNDGAFILIKKNKSVEKPIHILHYLEGEARLLQPRNLIIAEEGSEARIVESFQKGNGNGAFINSVSEISVAENAKLEFNKIQDIGPENSHIATEQISQQRNSDFSITTFSLSGKLLRNNLNIILQEENAVSYLNGLYLAKGTQHVDNHTVIDHMAPHCNSNETYKGILNERSTGVFNGRVLVRRAAQKTNAFQSNANILLTDEATSNSKPELEIYADDVKCSHGSTTGQLDEEALFYLQARGIGKDAARNMLLQAFAGEVLEKSSIEEVKEKIGNYLVQRYHNKF